MFGHLLHWLPTREEYAALTVFELEEFREVCQEINRASRG